MRILISMIGIVLATQPLAAQFDSAGCVRGRKTVVINQNTQIITYDQVRCTWVPERRHLIRGDDEFADNGPEVRLRAHLYSPDGQRLYAFLSMDARELRPDWTRIRGANDLSRPFLVHEADAGYRIATFTPRQDDCWTYVDANVAAESIRPRDLYRGHGIWSSPRMAIRRTTFMKNTTNNSVVSEWIAVGDVRGPDLGKTGMAVTFETVRVWIVRK